MNRNDLVKWDRALKLYCEATGSSIRILSGILGTRKHGLVSQTFLLASSVLAHFWASRVKPFLILPGPVEIDETKVPKSKAKCSFRWEQREASCLADTACILPSRYCRQTKLVSLYHI